MCKVFGVRVKRFGPNTLHKGPRVMYLVGGGEGEGWVGGWVRSPRPLCPEDEPTPCNPTSLGPATLAHAVQSPQLDGLLFGCVSDGGQRGGDEQVRPLFPSRGAQHSSRRAAGHAGTQATVCADPCACPNTPCTPAPGGWCSRCSPSSSRPSLWLRGSCCSSAASSATSRWVGWRASRAGADRRPRVPLCPCPHGWPWVVCALSCPCPPGRAGATPTHLHTHTLRPAHAGVQLLDRQQDGQQPHPKVVTLPRGWVSAAASDARYRLRLLMLVLLMLLQDGARLPPTGPLPQALLSCPP